MKIFLILIVSSFATFVGKSQNPTDYPNDIIHFLDKAGDFFKSISEKHKKEQGVDQLTYLLNDIDVLYTSEKSILTIIARTDSQTLVNSGNIWRNKSNIIIASLTTIVDDFRSIQPLLNATLHSQVDTIVYSIQEYLGYRKSMTLTEIDEYLSAHSKISKAEVLNDGNIGLGLLLECKVKISDIIKKLS